MLTAKCCINIAFFRCHKHFSHIAVSLYTKWQHQLIQQVMAHWWLLHHSALDLLADSLSSQPWLDPHSLGHMALQVQSVTRTESGWNKCVSYQNFRSPRWYPHPTPSPIKSDPCTLQSVVPCLWIKFAYFSERRKRLIWNWILTNPYRSVRRLVPVSLSDWPDIVPNWSEIFSSQSSEDTIPDMEFGTSLSACNIIRIYSKVEDYEIENKTRVDTEYEWEKMVAAST